jgi:hypothetical protein
MEEERQGNKDQYAMQHHIQHPMSVPGVVALFRSLSTRHEASFGMSDLCLDVPGRGGSADASV